MGLEYPPLTTGLEPAGGRDGVLMAPGLLKIEPPPPILRA